MDNEITIDKLKALLQDIFLSERSSKSFDAEQMLAEVEKMDKESNKKKMSYSEAKDMQKNIKSYNKETDRKVKELQEAIKKYQSLVDGMTEEEKKANAELLKERENELKQRKKEIEERQQLAKESEEEVQEHWGKAAKNAVAVINMVNSAVNMVFIALNANLERQKVRMEAANELTMRQINVYGNAIKKLSVLASGNITQSTKDNAFSSIETVWEIGKAQQIKKLEDELTQQQLRTNLNRIGIEESAGLMKEGVVLATTAAGAIIGSVVPGIGTAVGAVIGAAVGLITNFIDKLSGLSIKKQELALEQQKYLTEQAKSHLEVFNEIAKPLLDVGKKISDVFLNFQDAAYKQGRSYGLDSNQLDFYARGVIAINKEMAALGMDETDYYKMQEAYSESNTGRNPLISGEESLLMGGLSKRLNLDVSTISNITGMLGVFNVSISDGSELLYDMSNTVSKMGLNATKFGKDLVKNLKLAEKYQFKGGIKGLMSMSAWAQKMRVDMNSFMSSMNSLRTGNIEDTIKRSAQLNVLGGNASVFSDPLSMLYNVYADPEQYAKNIAKSLKGFGSFDTSTGMTKFNITEQMRIEAMAKAYGMSNEEMFNIARQQDKENQIKKRYGGKFGEKTDFVTQNATWSKEKQQFVVKVKDNSEAEGFREVELSKLSENSEELKNIFPEDKQERLIDYVRQILDRMSGKEKMEVADKTKESTLVSGGYETLNNIYGELYAEAMRHFNAAADFYAYGVEETARTMLRTTSETNRAIEENKENIKKTFDVVNDENINSFVKLTKDVFEEGGAYHGAWKAWAEGADHLQALIDYLEKRIKGETIEEDQYTKNIQISRDTYQEAAELRAKGDKSSARAVERAADVTRSTVTGVSTHFTRDFIISPDKKEVTVPHPDDVIMGWKTGGPIDNAFSRLNDTEGRKTSGGSNNINLTVNGTLTLSTGNQKIDLMELVRNDPDSLRRLTEKILLEASSNKYGGRHTFNASRYTI